MNINEYLEKKRIEIESSVFYSHNFKTAEIAKFSREEYQDYEDSLKYYRDLKNSLDTAKEERTVEIAINMLKKGLEISLISEITGLTEKEIKNLQK